MDEFAEQIEVMNEEPLVLRLEVPDGVYKSYAVAESIAEIMVELLRRYPERSFQFIPLQYRPDGKGTTLSQILAIA